MVYVLLAWSYIFLTAFLTGFSLLGFLGPGLRRSVTDVLMAGLAALLVYAQVYSLFAGVGAAANGVLTVFCLLSAVRFRRQLWDFFRERRKGCGPGKLAAAAVLVLVMAYGTSRGIMHVDTGLYHAQAIRWIEEYGVVPGLGNLHSRFAYNSSALCLCALYSLKWLFSEPLHVVQGFFALLVAVQCAPLLSVFGGRRVAVSDFLRCGAVYYLTVLYGEMVSPATDYFAMLLVFYILIAWLDLTERGEREAEPYALLCLLTVAAVTVKLSTAALLLLVCKPAAMLIGNRQWKKILFYIGLGVLTALPWLIRNVLISGWLVYPFTFIDLFCVDWKMEKGLADFDSKEIQVYARGIYDVNRYDTPFLSWAWPWFLSLKGLEKAWVAMSALGTAAVGIFLGKGALAAMQNRREEQNAAIARRSDSSGSPFGKAEPLQPGYGDRLIYGAALAACYLAWQFSAPLVRYGYAYVIALPAVAGGFWYCRGPGSGERGKKLFLVLLTGFLIYKTADLAGGMAERAKEPWYIRQQTYGTFPAYTYEVDGVTVYVPKEGGQIGYDKFPSSPWVQEIKLRGEKGQIRYGFRKKE